MIRIFVVDDEPGICIVLEMALTDEGYEVTPFTDSREAAQRLTQLPPPDAMIVDLFMPGMSGRALIENIRQRPELRNVPVIVLTGAVPGPEVLPPAGSYQALIGKPFDLDRLLATVRDVLPAASLAGGDLSAATPANR